MTAVKANANMGDGPTLETYVETRFNLIEKFINEKFSAQDVAMRGFVDSTAALIDAARKSNDALYTAADIRYQQRFEAQSDALAAAFLAQQTAMKTALEAAEKAVQAALAAQERAVLKAELASDKRFESVNEFRKTLADQQATFMPRSETTVMVGGFTQRLSGLKEQVDALMSERAGVKGGWGYAIGLVGAILTIGTLILLAIRTFTGAGK